MNSENVDAQNLSIWRLLLLNSSSSWDFCWMQSTHNENDSAGILSLSLSLFWFFCVTHFHFSIWICIPLLSELDLVKQSHFLFWIRRIFTAVFFLFCCHSLVHNTHFFFFLFTSACSAPISRTQHCLLRSPKLLFDLPPPRRCRPSSLQKQTRAPCNGFMIQPWPVPLFHMCTSGNIWGILIQML